MDPPSSHSRGPKYAIGVDIFILAIDSSCRGCGPLAFPFPSYYDPCKTKWIMIDVGCSNPNQVVSPVVTVVFNVICLLEKINITLAMWYVVIDWPNVFSMLIRKRYQGQSPFTVTLSTSCPGASQFFPCVSYGGSKAPGPFGHGTEYHIVLLYW